MSKGVYNHASIRDRARLWWRGVVPATRFMVTGRWEGHERDRRRYRPATRLESQDESLDMGTREGLMDEARQLSQTFGLTKRITRQFANYCVGQCSVQWLTEDDDWNTATEDAFTTWAQQPDYLQGLSLRRMARLGVISKKRDGDVFWLERITDGRYTLEAIEADRVGNIHGNVNIDAERIIGGVLLDAQGRPAAYRVLNRSRYGTFKDPVDVPAFRMIHYWDRDRFDARRGVTAFHVALNDLRDLKESKTAAQLKQKLASKLALLVKNATGGPLPGINPFGEDTTLTEGNTVKTEEVGDLAIQYMFNGDSMEAFKSEFPHDSWFQLTDLLIRDIAIGLDLPYEFVWDMAKLTGPGVRMMSKQAERTFTAEQDDLDEMFFNRVIGRWLANEIAEGRIDPHPQMSRWKVQRPSHPSIDAGRDSVANLNERKAGVRSGGSIAAEQGSDIYDVHKEIEREVDDKIRRAKVLADRHGIPLETALAMMGHDGGIAKAAEGTQPGDRDGDEQSRDEKKEADADLLDQMTMYGVAVRAGAVTPTIDDENLWRERLRLGRINPDIKRAWREERNVRRPVTLSQPGGGATAPQKSQQEDDDKRKARQDEDEETE